MTEKIRDLQELVKGMKPRLLGDFAFCRSGHDGLRHLEGEALGMFREAEGVTVLLELQEARRRELPVHWVGTQITLEVQSCMDSVGFLAAVCGELATHGIAVNVFSPISHDHLFVKPEEAQRALEILERMSAEG